MKMEWDPLTPKNTAWLKRRRIFAQKKKKKGKMGDLRFTTLLENKMLPKVETQISPYFQVDARSRFFIFPYFHRPPLIRPRSFCFHQVVTSSLLFEMRHAKIHAKIIRLFLLISILVVSVLAENKQQNN